MERFKHLLFTSDGRVECETDRRTEVEAVLICCGKKGAGQVLPSPMVKGVGSD